MDQTRRQITKIAREAGKLTVRMMKETGIGSGEFDLIHAVRHTPGISQSEICQQLNMDKGAVARRVASLEAKGYLTRRKNPEDGRGQMLYATEAAEERQTFALLLHRLYARSKQERREGFPHVIARLEETEGDA